jgi:hypothetical protein
VHPLPFIHQLVANLGSIAVFKKFALPVALEAMETYDLHKWAGHTCSGISTALIMPSIELEGGSSQVLCTGARAAKQVLTFLYVMVSVMTPLAIVYVQERASKLGFLRARGVEPGASAREGSVLLVLLYAWACSTICWSLLSVWHFLLG